MNSKHVWLDSLKGIAMLGVIAVHSGAGALPSVFGKIGACGKFGVQLFFMISAMLAFASYDRNIRNGGKALKWIVKKLLYLVPFYYIILLLSLVTTGGAKGYYANDTSVTIWNILTHLTFTMGLFPKYANSIIGTEWYLGVFVIFLVLVPILYRIIKSEAYALIGIIISTLLFDIIDRFTYVLIPAGANEHVHSLFWGQFSIFPNAPILLSGILLYFIFNRREDNKDNYKVLSIAMIGIFLILAAGLVLNADRLFLVPYTLIWATGFALLIIGQSYHPWVIMDNPVLRIIGRNTYCMYLSHYLLLLVYDRIVRSFGNPVIDWSIKYLTVIIISLCVSELYHRVADKPYKKMCEYIER